MAALAVVACAGSPGRPDVEPPPKSSDAPEPRERASWRSHPVFLEIERALEPIGAVDNHTHILWPPRYDPKTVDRGALMMQMMQPAFDAVIEERFGDAGRNEAAALRMERLGAQGPDYWVDHLDAIGTAVALVNQQDPPPDAGGRLQWVPNASYLLFPVPADGFVRHPRAAATVRGAAKVAAAEMETIGLEAPPADLASYLEFVDAVFARWNDEGAVAVKFFDAYIRTLRFEEVGEDEAAALFERGRDEPLSFEEYLRLQNHIARHMFLEAGELGLAVHVHSSSGIPPFLRLGEADVRNLEAVLADPRFFGTQFVLIHGGHPLIEEAAYLGNKPHVWIDVSALPFLLPVPELAHALRQYLLMAPDSVLFGTDAASSPPVPVGPEIQHAVLTRHLREALYAALASFVNDGVMDIDTAIRLGEGVLRGNAERLYGFEAPGPGGSDRAGTSR